MELTDCEHKGVFPILTSEYIGLIIMPLLLGIASVAGLGGGVVFVPLMMAFFHFKTKETVAMSLAIVFESGLIRTLLFSWWAKHPERPTTEIDFNTIRVVYPIFLVGSYFGVLTSMALPEIVMCVSLVLLLTYLVGDTFIKGRRMWIKEGLAILERDNKPFSEQEELSVWNNGRMQTEVMIIDRSRTEELELEFLLRRESCSTNQWWINLEMFILTLLSIAVNFIRGSRSFDSIFGIETCSPMGWSVLFSFIALCCFVTYKNLKQLIHEQYLKNKYGKGLAKSDILHEGSTTTYLVIWAFLGSWIGVTFGLGGGIIFNPVQIAMGVNPIVASSTSMYMIMLTTFASTVMYIYNGQFMYRWTGWFMLWCGMGVVFGMVYI